MRPQPVGVDHQRAALEPDHASAPATDGLVGPPQPRAERDGPGPLAAARGRPAAGARSAPARRCQRSAPAPAPPPARRSPRLPAAPPARTAAARRRTRAHRRRRGRRPTGTWSAEAPLRGTRSSRSRVASAARVGDSTWAGCRCRQRSPTRSGRGPARQQPQLAARGNATVKSARTAIAATTPVDASTPEGTSSATTGAAAALIASMRGARLAPGRAAEAGAEHRVDDHVRRRSSRGHARRAGRTSTGRSRRAADREVRAGVRGGRPTGRRAAPTSRMPAACRCRATTNPSPPLLPAAADDRRPLHPAQRQHLVRGGDAGALHQHDAGNAERLDRGCVERPPLVRRRRAGAARSRVVHDGHRPGHPLRVGHRQVDRAGRDVLGERRAYLPGQASRDGLGRPEISMSVHMNSTPQPERLADRLLAGEAGGEVLGRVRPREAVLALGLG